MVLFKTSPIHTYTEVLEAILILEKMYMKHNLCIDVDILHYQHYYVLDIVPYKNEQKNKL